MAKNFSDRLMDAIDEKQNPSCFGLDPRILDVPWSIRKVYLEKAYSEPESDRDVAILQATVDAILKFDTDMIDATFDIVPAYKPNIAFYEQYGWRGIQAFEKVISYIRSKGCIPVTDGKRNEIGDTAEAYARGHLGAVEMIDSSAKSSGLNTDAITVTAYIGSDTVKPFINEAKRFGKGVIVLAKTSNDSSGELQDLYLDKFHGGRQVFEEMCLRIHVWGEDMKGERGYSSVCAVVGANYPEHAERARIIMPRTTNLVPAYGQQGAKAIHCMPNFTEEGYGALVNNARQLLNSYRDEKYKRFKGDYKEATRQAALDMKCDLHDAMKKTGKFPW